METLINPGKEKFVFLISASDPECSLICQRLKITKIEYLLEDYSQNAYQRLYGAHPSIGRKIFVPRSKIKEAKGVLGLKDGFLSVAEFRKLPLAPKILIYAAVITLLFASVLLLIFSVFGPEF